MTILIFGLILFLGIHAVRIFAEPWRNTQITKLGDGKWKGLYSLVSIFGFVLISVGYGQARLAPIVVWSPPLWTWHIAVALNLVAFVLLTAAYVPQNHLKAKLEDPMIIGVKTWALAHLISNGTLAGIILFGSFLVWAVLDYRSCRKRRSKNMRVPQTRTSVAMTLATLAIGLAGWALFLLYAHQTLMGIQPLI